MQDVGGELASAAHLQPALLVSVSVIFVPRGNDFTMRYDVLPPERTLATETLTVPETRVRASGCDAVQREASASWAERVDPATEVQRDGLRIPAGRQA